MVLQSHKSVIRVIQVFLEGLLTIVSIVSVTGSDGGCFHGDGQVKVSDDSLVKISDDGTFQVSDDSVIQVSDDGAVEISDDGVV